MRLLFVHRSFPGQFLHLIQALARAGDHQIVFITQPTTMDIAGVHKVTYHVTPASHRTHRDAADFDAAMRRATAVAEVATGLREGGFKPDIIIGHEGWGETLNLVDVWPAVRLIGYREYFYHYAGADVGFDAEFPLPAGQASMLRAKNAVAAQALLAANPGVSPTRWQRSLYPAWAQPAIALVPDGVDLETCQPDPSRRAKPFRLGDVQINPAHHLVTYVARDLEPYRGFHIFARALPRLLARPDLQVVCVGGNGVSYGLPPPTGTWRDRMLAELDGRIDLARLHFPGQIGYADYVGLLQRSDVHVYLSYPFIASWSLREALAIGCNVVAGDTPPVREFISHCVTGILTPPLSPDALADEVLALLDDPLRRVAISGGARRWAVANLSLSNHLTAWQAVISDTKTHLAFASIEREVD